PKRISMHGRRLAGRDRVLGREGAQVTSPRSAGTTLPTATALFWASCSGTAGLSAISRLRHRSRHPTLTHTWLILWPASVLGRLTTASTSCAEPRSCWHRAWTSPG